MHITQVFLRFNRMPNGHIFRGKQRLVRKVTPAGLRDWKERFAVEEQNMFYLRFPYLSEEQSKGHAKALGKQEQFKRKWQLHNASRFKEDVFLAERLLHLRVKESWD